jgi:hypothetical protein
MPRPPERGELVSLDETIDAIAREALAEARRRGEVERYRNNSGPAIPPPKMMITPK